MVTVRVPTYVPAARLNTGVAADPGKVTFLTRELFESAM
jgi:hypothetical protein